MAAVIDEALVSSDSLAGAAIVDGDRTVTWLRLRSLVALTAAKLRGCGFPPGLAGVNQITVLIPAAVDHRRHAALPRAEANATGQADRAGHIQRRQRPSDSNRSGECKCQRA